MDVVVAWLEKDGCHVMGSDSGQCLISEPLIVDVELAKLMFVDTFIVVLLALVSAMVDSNNLILPNNCLPFYMKQQC